MTALTLEEIVSRFPQIRVVVLGDAMLDEYVTGECVRLSPEAPIPVLRVRQSRSVPGGAANTAANIAALGGKAVLVGALGTDETGRRLTDLIEQSGVATDLVADTRPTSRKVRALGGQQQLLRLDYEDDGPVPAEVANALLARFELHLTGASIVVISDYAKGIVSRDVCDKVLRLAAGAGVPVVIDPRPQHGAFYAGCDYLTPNWKEAQALLGDVEGPASPAALEQVGRRLADKYRAGVLLTLGAMGLRFYPRDGGPVVADPARALEVFDVSGAGDTVVASFAMALAAGADVPSALRLANRAAGLVVGKVGTATISSGELLGDDSTDRRILDRPTLARLAQEWRRDRRSVILVTGAFDAIDARDVTVLRQGRDRGDVLIAAVLDGDSRGRADTPDTARVRLLLALRDVDFVHVTRDIPGAVALLGPDVQVRNLRVETEEVER